MQTFRLAWRSGDAFEDSTGDVSRVVAGSSFVNCGCSLLLDGRMLPEAPTFGEFSLSRVFLKCFPPSTPLLYRLVEEVPLDVEPCADELNEVTSESLSPCHIIKHHQKTINQFFPFDILNSL